MPREGHIEVIEGVPCSGAPSMISVLNRASGMCCGDGTSCASDYSMVFKCECSIINVLFRVRLKAVNSIVIDLKNVV